MTKGTKSLLFGVHQFIWHPITVWMAWVWLYRKIPNIQETVCIIIHDWGYWGKENMDDEKGESHPELGAKIAGRLFGLKCRNLCLYHSRHYARKDNVEPSKLCWPDKLSIKFEPWWFYLPRAWLSGELQEYRLMASKANKVSIYASHRFWFKWVKNMLMTIGRKQRGDVVPYINPERSL